MQIQEISFHNHPIVGLPLPDPHLKSPQEARKHGPVADLLVLPDPGLPQSGISPGHWRHVNYVVLYIHTVHVHLYIHVHIYIYMYIYMCIYICIYIYMCIYIYVLYIYIFICICIYIYVDIYICRYIYIYM